MEDLIANASVLFDERGPGVSSPPLPPAPLGHPAPNYAYGSAHTKVASLPASQQASVRQQAQQQANQPEDFTPKLPARPGNSIHPSSRGNPATPTRNNFDTTAPLMPGRGAQTQHTKSERPATPIRSAAAVPISPPAPTAAAAAYEGPPSPSSSFSSSECDGDSDFDMVTPVAPARSTTPPSPNKPLTRTPRSTAPVLPALPAKDIKPDPAPSPSVPGAFTS